MKNVLWLTSWFPHDGNRLTGDFVERHAKSASIKNRITVLHVVKVAGKIFPQQCLIEHENYLPNLSLVILYYPPFSKWRVVEKCVSGLRYYYYYRKLIRTYINEKGRPDLVHLHVIVKAGLLALYLKWRFHLPFVISEHWSGFLQAAEPGVKDLSFIKRSIMRVVFRQASAVSAVSNHLSNSIKQQYQIKQITIIPNVVDCGMFFPKQKSSALFRFIHVSTLKYEKNPELLIKAAAILYRKLGPSFTLTVYGPPDPVLLQLTRDNGLQDQVRFAGEVAQDVLAVDMRAHNALILNSRYETFGCVVIEAMASGIPVIVSDIPAMRELVIEYRTGVYFKANDPDSLAGKMSWMMAHYAQFESSDLHARAESLFGFEHVSAKFDEFYAC